MATGASERGLSARTGAGPIGHVNVRRRPVVRGLCGALAVAVGALTFSACSKGRSGSDSPASSSLSSPKGPVDPGEWASSACAALGAWLAELQAQGQQLAGLATADDPTAVHDQLVTFLGGAVQASASARDYLVALGAPQAADGSAASAAAITAQVAQVHDLLAAALTRVDATEATDADSLARSARDIATVLEQGVAATDVSGPLATPTELDSAFESVPTCQSLRETT